jgi:replicative DNA helicase
LHRIFPGTDPATIDAANKAVSSFKTLAKRLDIPVVMLCQLNKGLESRSDKRPTLCDLSLFNAIERESDMVCGVYREEYYNKDTVDCGITEIIGMKNRHGSAQNIKLLSNMGQCNYAGMPNEY